MYTFSLNCNALVYEGSKENNANSANKDNSVQVFNYNNSKLALSKNDIYLMAQVVFAESRSEPFEGKVAVASVILNRVLSPEFPKSVEGVIKQKNAFSCVVNGKISLSPDASCFEAVYTALGGTDPTEHALFYYNPQIATCNWMKNVKKDNIKSIGQHVFFVINN
jgi:N-acetylmuramoyl-L-alanine amidase